MAVKWPIWQPWPAALLLFIGVDTNEEDQELFDFDLHIADKRRREEGGYWNRLQHEI